MIDILQRCETYFAERADAEIDASGTTGNEEMELLVEIRAALATLPSNEALAGEGVEGAALRLVGYIAGLPRDHRWSREVKRYVDEQAEAIDARAKAARTLPSNEALAGDDRNVVEGLIERLCERARTYTWDSGVFYASDAELMREAAAALSRPQADVADVERVASNDEGPIADRARRIASYTDGPARINVYKAAKQELAAITTMTTRPAGREGVEKGRYIVAWLTAFAPLVPGADLVNALHCAEAAYADDPASDPVETAESEADEWRRAS